MQALPDGCSLIGSSWRMASICAFEIMPLSQTIASWSMPTAHSCFLHRRQQRLGATTSPSNTGHLATAIVRQQMTIASRRAALAIRLQPIRTSGRTRERARCEIEKYAAASLECRFANRFSMIPWRSISQPIAT